MGPIVSLAERRERRRRGRGLREASCRACVAEHVRNELRSLAPRARWTASDWALHTAALHVDLARLRRFADAGPGGLDAWLSAADAVLAELRCSSRSAESLCWLTRSYDGL